MNANLLTPNKDPMGYAIADYFSKGKAGRLRVFSSQFDEDEIPVDQLFRTFDEMPVLEQKALELAKEKSSIVVLEADAMPWLYKIWARTWKPLISLLVR